MKNKFFALMVLVAVILLVQGVHAATSLQIQANVLPKTVAPGNELYTEVTITNIGPTSIESVNLKSVSVDPRIVQTTPIFLDDLGSLGAGKTLTTNVKFRVPESTGSGFYPVTFSIEACQSNTCDSYTASALITVQSSPMIDIASISPTSFSPGETGTINFVLSNKGDADIINVLFTWADSSGTVLPLGSDNRKVISNIKAGSDTAVPASIIVSPDAKPGVYQLSIEISYTDSAGNLQKIASTAGMSIAGNYNFIVSLETQDAVAQGMKGSAEIKIANAGTQDANFLTIKVLPSEQLGQITPSVIYVGNLKSNDYDNEKFQFAADAAMGVYPLKLELSYKDSYGQSYSEVHSIDIRISSKNEVQTPSSLPTIAVVVVFVVLFFVYMDFRRRRKNKK